MIADGFRVQAVPELSVFIGGRAFHGLNLVTAKDTAEMVSDRRLFPIGLRYFQQFRLGMQASRQGFDFNISGHDIRLLKHGVSFADGSDRKQPFPLIATNDRPRQSKQRLKRKGGLRRWERLDGEASGIYRIDAT